jgi:hypothetical protein
VKHLDILPRATLGRGDGHEKGVVIMIKDSDSTHSNAPLNTGEMSEAEIDKNLQDTFPASDPPSWTVGTDHRQETPLKDKSDEDEPPRH